LETVRSKATRNALRILTLASATNVAVAKGAGLPLKQSLELGNYVQRASALDRPEMPEPGMEVSELTAGELMHRVLEEGDALIALVITGPMINMAQLLRDYINSLAKITEVIFMGGSIDRGNHTPSAEFVTFADPEALNEVIKSDVPLRMVSHNLNHRALAVPSIVERMQAMKHVIEKTCAEWMGFFGSSYRSLWSFDAPPVHDPCSLVALVDHTLIQWQKTFLAVELDGKWSRGETIVDLHNRLELPSNASAAMKLDSARYWDLVLDSIEHLGRARS